MIEKVLRIEGKGEAERQSPHAGRTIGTSVSVSYSRIDERSERLLAYAELDHRKGRQSPVKDPRTGTFEVVCLILCQQTWKAYGNTTTLAFSSISTTTRTSIISSTGILRDRYGVRLAKKVVELSSRLS